MKLGQRIERLEVASSESIYRRWAEHFSEEWGIPAERLVREFIEIADRIERNGLDEEIRRIATKGGHSEEKVREDFEEALASLPKLGDE